MQERLVHRQLEVVDAASTQLGGGVIVSEPAAPAVADERLAGLGLLAAKHTGAQPASLGGVGELQRHAVVLLCKPLESARDVRLSQVAQHDKHRAVCEHGGELIQFFGECGLFVEPIVPQLVQPKKHAVARHAWPGVEVAFAAADNADRAHAVERSQRQSAGDLHCPGVFAHAGGGDAHRAGRVDEQINWHLLGCLVLLNERTTHSGGNAPVNLFHRVASLVRAALCILDTGAGERRRVGAVLQTVGQTPHGDGELASVESVVRFEAAGERFHMRLAKGQTVNWPRRGFP